MAWKGAWKSQIVLLTLPQGPTTLASSNLTVCGPMYSSIPQCALYWYNFLWLIHSAFPQYNIHCTCALVCAWCLCRRCKLSYQRLMLLINVYLQNVTGQVPTRICSQPPGSPRGTPGEDLFVFMYIVCLLANWMGARGRLLCPCAVCPLVYAEKSPRGGLVYLSYTVL